MSFFLAICTITAIFSCTKQNVPAVTAPPIYEVPKNLSLIQNKWTFISLVIYPTAEFSGINFVGFMGKDSEYFNFETDGKLYTFVQNQYDTADYKVFADSTVLLNQYYSGIRKEISDTITIRTLTNSSFIFAHKNSAGDWGKFSFKK